VIKAANTLIVLTEDGELVLVEMNPTAYREIDRFKPLSLYCWNRPVLSNGRIYARNSAANSEILALDVSLPSGGLPQLSIAAARVDGTAVDLSIQSTTGVPLNTDDANRVELIYSSDVRTPMASWIRLDEPLTVSGQGLRARIPLLPERARFIRVREKP